MAAGRGAVPGSAGVCHATLGEGRALCGPPWGLRGLRRRQPPAQRGRARPLSPDGCRRAFSFRGLAASHVRFSLRSTLNRKVEVYRRLDSGAVSCVGEARSRSRRAFLCGGGGGVDTAASAFGGLLLFSWGRRAVLFPGNAMQRAGRGALGHAGAHLFFAPASPRPEAATRCSFREGGWARIRPGRRARRIPALFSRWPTCCDEPNRFDY